MGERTSPIRVVLIDDHAMFTESLARVLGDEPSVEVVGVAATGKDGVGLAALCLPDVVVVSQELPDSDMSSIAPQLLEASPKSSVVVLSSRNDHRSMLAALEAGCIGFVTTDGAVNDLLAAVAQVAGGDPYVPPSMLSALLPGRDKPGLGGDLSERELEVLRGLGRGLTNSALADSLFLSAHTVRGHVQSILLKLGAHSRLEAVAIAQREGLLPSPR